MGGQNLRSCGISYANSSAESALSGDSGEGGRARRGSDSRSWARWRLAGRPEAERVPWTVLRVRVGRDVRSREAGLDGFNSSGYGNRSHSSSYGSGYPWLPELEIGESWASDKSPSSDEECSPPIVMLSLLGDISVNRTVSTFNGRNSSQDVRHRGRSRVLP